MEIIEETTRSISFPVAYEADALAALDNAGYSVASVTHIEELSKLNLRFQIDFMEDTLSQLKELNETIDDITSMGASRTGFQGSYLTESIRLVQDAALAKIVTILSAIVPANEILVD